MKENIKLSDVAPKIAAALGANVTTPNEGEWCVQLSGCEVPFTITKRGYGSDQNRLCIAIDYPKDCTGRAVTTQDIHPRHDDGTITVDGARDAAAIAKDIIRRFFPVAKVAYAACVARAAGVNTYHDEKFAVATRLAAAIPGATVLPRLGSTPARVGTTYANTVNDVELLGETVRVQIEATPDKLVAILDTLRAANLL